MTIAIATAFYNSMTFSAYTASIVATCKLLQTKGIEYDYWELPSDTYVHRGKNIISNYFLESNCTDLVIIDSDMSWNPYDLLRLLENKHPVIGVNYPCKNAYDKWAGKAVVENNRVDIVDGIAKAEIIPGGFIKINRAVFEQIAAKSDEYYYENGKKKHDFWSHLKVNGIEKGDDISFCMRCKDVGFDLHIMTDSTITHHGFHGWTGNYNTFLTKGDV